MLQVGLGLSPVAAPTHAVPVGELVHGAFYPGSDRIPGLVAGNCVGQPETSSTCLTDEPVTTNTDAPLGGHGTLVSGVAVGDDYTLPDGTSVGGNAPGARIVMISATMLLLGVANAFSRVPSNHDAPCGAGVPALTCPPIRVVSASWGTSDPVIVSREQQLVQAGVVVVWANGNDGGDGSTNKSNPGPSMDPTPGVLTVASYDDLGTGTRDGVVSPSSSRGAAAQPQTWPDISAPGVDIVSSCRPGMLICATPAQIDDALKATAHKYADGAPYVAVGPYTSSDDEGTGVVDAAAAALRLGARPANGG